MSAQRGAAALAAMITALLLQGALVAPLAVTVPLSLPAVLVAAAALIEGPTTGMALGFSLGLVADLGSSHPAGVLALSWLGLGLVSGLAGDRRTVLGDVVITALCCAVATLFAGMLLALVHAGGASAWVVARATLPAGLGDAALALAVIPIVRGFLRTETLRAGRGLVPEPDLGTARG